MMKKIPVIALCLLLIVCMLPGCEQPPEAVEYPDFIQGTVVYNGDFGVDENGVLWDYTGTESDVVIPDNIGIVGIAYGAFQDSNRTTITSITIPKTVTGIGDQAFQFLYNLTNINVNAGNTNYLSNSGVLFNKKQTILIQYPVGRTGEYSIPSKVKYIEGYAFWGCAGLTNLTMGNRLKSIGDSAFSGCSGLTGITIGNSIEEIGNNTFSGCSGLINISIPDSVATIEFGTFEKCSGLESVTIGNGVTSIGETAFYGCTGLTSLTIPNSVTSIASNAFANCTGLTTINIGSGITNIGDGMLSGEVTIFDIVDSGCTGLTNINVDKSNIYYSSNAGVLFNKEQTTLIQYPVGRTGEYSIPDSVTHIGASAFSRCPGLTNVTVPDSVFSIGRDAFSGTAWYNNQPDGLIYAGRVAYGYKGTMPANAAIELLAGTKGIGQAAFYGCSGLSSITIPDSMTNIGDSAFSGCSGLTSVEIPANVTSIEKSAFSGCTGLKNININAGNNNYLSNTGVLFNAEKTTLIQYPGGKTGDYTIPDGVTSIGESAFYCCSGLTSIIIPNGVISIGELAFSACTGLTSLAIPDGVTIISKSAFSGCIGLTNINIPDGVTSIGEQAFSGCSGLTNITIPDGVTDIGELAFNGCTGLTSVSIGSGVTSIGAFAFSGCNELMSISVDESNTKYSSDAGVLFNKAQTKLLHYPGGKTGDYVIPNSVQNINEWAFSECKGLTSITIPNSMKDTWIDLFSDCAGLISINIEKDNREYSSNAGVLFNKSQTTLIQYPRGKTGAYTIPDGVTSIGDGSFSECKGLTSIIIPDSVTSIGHYAFSSCTGLKNIIIPDSVATIGKSAFYGCDFLTVHGKNGPYDEYFKT